ncbi:hypothetical protein Drorol1_Dr00021530 [Drosera rotundifolia]
MQIPLVWHELSRCLAEKYALWARKGQNEVALKEALPRAKIIERKLKEALDSLTAPQAKAVARDGILMETDNKISEMREELAKTHADYKTLYWHVAESQAAVKNAQAEVSTTKSKNATLRLKNEKHQQVIKEQLVEMMRLKSANRSHRHEL